MKSRRRTAAGFTLVEILIVVIILGVLAAVAIPKFSELVLEGEGAALDVNLSELRKAVELYYHEHGGIYPGAVNEVNGNPVSNANQAETSFLAQLTLYSDKAGKTNDEKTAVFRYGPYMKRVKLPDNPFNNDSDVVCDIVSTDISSVVSDGTTGWKFFIMTGRIMANDGAHDSR